MTRSLVVAGSVRFAGGVRSVVVDAGGRWFTLHGGRAVVLGSAHTGFVGGSFPFLDHHSFPQCASGAPVVAHWVGDQRYRAAGAPGLPLWVPDPLRALAVPQDTSGAPVVVHWVPNPLGAGEEMMLRSRGPRVGPLGARSPARTDRSTGCLRGPSGGPLVGGSPGHRQILMLPCRAPGLALWVPDPLRALTVSLDALGASGGPLGAKSPGRWRTPSGATESPTPGTFFRLTSTWFIGSLFRFMARYINGYSCNNFHESFLSTMSRNITGALSTFLGWVLGDQLWNSWGGGHSNWPKTVPWQAPVPERSGAIHRN